MKEKKKKKRKLKAAGIIFIIILVILLISLYLFFFGGNIENIYIKGNNILSDQEIIELASIDDYPSFYKTTSLSIKRRILSNMYIKDVKVTKKLGRRIDIEVFEYKILFKRLDKDVYVLENKKEYAFDKELDVLILLNYIPNTIYDSFVSKLSKIDDKIFKKISEIKYDPNDYDDSRFALYMDDGNLVYVTLSRFDALNKYDDIVPTLDGKKGTLNLDSGNYFEIK